MKTIAFSFAFALGLLAAAPGMQSTTAAAPGANAKAAPAPTLTNQPSSGAARCTAAPPLHVLSLKHI